MSKRILNYKYNIKIEIRCNKFRLKYQIIIYNILKRILNYK